MQSPFQKYLAKTTTGQNLPKCNQPGGMQPGVDVGRGEQQASGVLDRHYGRYTQQTVKQLQASLYQAALSLDFNQPAKQRQGEQQIRWFKEDWFPQPQTRQFQKTSCNPTTPVHAIRAEQSQCKVKLGGKWTSQRKAESRCVQIKCQGEQQKEVGWVIDKKRSQVINHNKTIQAMANLEKILFTNQNKTAKMLKQHIAKGPAHKFTFDIDGELLLFKQKHQRNHTDHYIQANSFINVGYKTSPDLSISSKKKPQAVAKQVEVRGADCEGEGMFNRTTKVENATSKTTTLFQTRNQGQKEVKANERAKVFSNNSKRQTTNMHFFNPQKGIKYSQSHTAGIFDVQSNESANVRKQYTSCSATRIKDFYKFIVRQKREQSQRLSRCITDQQELTLKAKTSRTYQYIPKSYRAKTEQKEVSTRQFFKRSRISIKNRQVAKTMMQD